MVGARLDADLAQACDLGPVGHYTQSQLDHVGREVDRAAVDAADLADLAAYGDLDPVGLDASDQP